MCCVFWKCCDDDRGAEQSRSLQVLGSPRHTQGALALATHGGGLVTGVSPPPHAGGTCSRHTRGALAPATRGGHSLPPHAVGTRSHHTRGGTPAKRTPVHIHWMGKSIPLRLLQSHVAVTFTPSRSEQFTAPSRCSDSAGSCSFTWQ